jgi:hypothetical protein
MAQITIEVPGSLAAQLVPVRDRLPEVMPPQSHYADGSLAA